MSGSQCEVPDSNPSLDEVASMLRESKRIAVVGLSDNPARDSYGVAQYMIDAGYEIIPVNPGVETVLGRKSYASLAQVPGHIDIVNIFRKPEAVPGIVKEAISVGAGAIWMQLGIAHHEAAQQARAAGLKVVQAKCIKVEHARLVR